MTWVNGLFDYMPFNILTQPPDTRPVLNQVILTLGKCYEHMQQYRSGYEPLPVTHECHRHAHRECVMTPAKSGWVHVVEPIAAAYSTDAYAININELQQEALSIAADNLGDIGEKCGIRKENQHTLLGSPAIEIRNLAAELDADAIVIGSHGHSGWKILLGSTANKVLHGASCDVLTVLVGKKPTDSHPARDTYGPCPDGDKATARLFRAP